MEDSFNGIKQLLINGETSDAIASLRNQFGNLSRDASSIDLLEARYNRLETSYAKGIINSADYSLELNRINDALLGILNNPGKGKGAIFPRIPSKILLYALAFILVVAGSLIFSHFNWMAKEKEQFIQSLEIKKSEIDKNINSVLEISEKKLHGKSFFEDSVKASLGKKTKVFITKVLESTQQVKEEFNELQVQRISAIKNDQLMLQHEIQDRIRLLVEKYRLENLIKTADSTKSEILSLQLSSLKKVLSLASDYRRSKSIFRVFKSNKRKKLRKMNKKIDFLSIEISILGCSEDSPSKKLHALEKASKRVENRCYRLKNKLAKTLEKKEKIPSWEPMYQ